MAELVFKLKKSKQKGPAPVEIILKENSNIYTEEVENSERVLEGLDKILKKSKIRNICIKNIKVKDLNKYKYTSYRIIKSIEKALKLKIF